MPPKLKQEHEIFHVEGRVTARALTSVENDEYLAYAYEREARYVLLGADNSAIFFPTFHEAKHAAILLMDLLIAQFIDYVKSHEFKLKE